MASENEWTVVNRRKNNRRSDLTSFFVSNIPDDTSVDEIRKLFVGFGKVADVYIARKKDRSRLNFGFVKFTGVKNAKSLEGSLGKLKLGNNILSVNIARFSRNGDAVHGMNISKKPASSHPPPPPSAWNIVGSRSFANVLSGSHTSCEKKVSRIHLNPCSEIDSALFNVFLFGETLDVGTLRKMPHNLKEAGIKFGKVFLYGGLTTLIGFDEPEEARKLLGDDTIWSKWFKWLKRGDSILNWKFERSVVLKIVGLPMQFRTPENLSKLLGHHGKILDMGDENVWKFEDLSFLNVNLLTESKTKINEHIIIDYGGGKQFSVGIFEDDVYMDPFDSIEEDKEDADSDDYESGSDGGSSGDDGLYSTEEGEIRSMCGDDVVVAESPSIADNAKSQPSPVMDNGRNEVEEALADPNASFGFNNQQQDNNFVFNAVAPLRQEVSRVDRVKKVNGFTPGLVESGCFGPFTIGLVNVNGRKLPESLKPSSVVNAVDPDLIVKENNNKKCRIEANPNIELNQSPALFNSSLNGDNVASCAMVSKATPPVSIEAPIADPRVEEMQRTVEIGKMLDVDIEMGNEILNDIMETNGVFAVPQ
ncbi:hypothetical protein L1887_35820 [Cichorium endivia]|nr:hypothetical protein L1887_35820 [Cichorium endivia]